MAAMGLQAIAREVGASYAGEDRLVKAAVIDSRQLSAGDLFVAVNGEHVDGHSFIEAAADRGAVAALVERGSDASIPCLHVESSLKALSRIGAANRSHYRGPLIAITGSNGKTSVKTLCEAIFSCAGVTVATAGNYNNEIGVPLTLSRIDDDTQYAIIEMGAARRGDVAHLCALAKPTVSTVLNAMEAHLEGFGTVADVADVKAEIFDDLGADGVAVVNLDQPWATLWEQRANNAGARVVRWSMAGTADLWVDDITDRGLEGSRFTLHIKEEALSVDLALPGRHNIANALAAAALAHAAGLSTEHIAAGLARVRSVPGRVQAERLRDGSTLIDDSYNANPGSMVAAIDLLARCEGGRLLILGEMRELGERSVALHEALGTRAREGHIDRFVGVGEALSDAVTTFGEGGSWYPDRDALIEDLQRVLAGADTILVKGSRGAAMDRVAQAIRDQQEVPAC